MVSKVIGAKYQCNSQRGKIGVEVVRKVFAEEEDILQRNTKWSKESHATGCESGKNAEVTKKYYKDTVMGGSSSEEVTQAEDDDEGNT